MARPYTSILPARLSVQPMSTVSVAWQFGCVNGKEQMDDKELDSFETLWSSCGEMQDCSLALIMAVRRID